MAPHQHEIERTEEWEEFMEKLEAFHADRGTRFDREPKVTQVSVDLFKLYKYVTGKGGYDALALEKNVWLKVANDLGIGQKTGVAFNLKTAYYKNLVAYEIRNYHNKTPPPKTILEDLTAAGGDVLSRNIETFHPKKANDSTPGSREASHDVGTPNRDTKAEDGGTPSSNRAARGLRSQPPQTTRYQPETASAPRRAPSTTTRHPSSSQQQHASSSSSANNDQVHQRSSSKMDSYPHSNGHPQPHAAAMGRASSHNMNANYGSPAHASPSLRAGNTQVGASALYTPEDPADLTSTVTNFQPPAAQPLTLRPVETPANAPAKFAKKTEAPSVPPMPRQAPDPSCFTAQPSPLAGPNIYVRCLNSILSPNIDDEQFACRHLPKISFERGDRYKFDGFPGLADGLAKVALRVGQLYYDVEWTVDNDPDSDHSDPSALDGVYGTSDILERIARLTPRGLSSVVQSDEDLRTKEMATEATQTFRNMIMLHDNAVYLADFPPLQDLLCIILNLPNIDDTQELKHMALDIAEKLTPGLIFEADDPLYRTLLLQLHSKDRGVLLTTLRALSTTSYNLDEANKLADVPHEILANLIDWLMLGDEELLQCSMDLLYQYTGVVSNVNNLLGLRNTVKWSGYPDHLITTLARLLSYKAKLVEVVHITKPEVKIPYSEEVATLPRDLQDRLLAMDEPERCYAWLKILFEEDPGASITQIAIWTAYQSSFSTKVSQMGKIMISPADFIRNVNHVWQTAGAQIIPASDRENRKFIIQGIRARHRPIDPETGKEYFRCLWSLVAPQAQKCHQFYPNAAAMFNHIMDEHLGVKKKVDELLKCADEDVKLQCFWAGCRKFPEPTEMKLSFLVKHIYTHLKVVEQASEPPSEPILTEDENGKRTLDFGFSTTKPIRANLHTIPAKSFIVINEETATICDERNPNVKKPVGIALIASLILRNIAQNVPKTQAEEELLRVQEERGVDRKARGWNEILFRGVHKRIVIVMEINKALSYNMSDILDMYDWN